MLIANSDQALHKSIMLRLLVNILDDRYLAQNLFFKGGTSASMLGYLDHFSVDLDFDLKTKKGQSKVQRILEKIFINLGLEIKDQSKNTIQYYLKYEAPENTRNTLKIDAVDIPYKSAEYEKTLLPEINRYAICQTKETIFSNKLVAIVNRYDRNSTIAGRDIYDIHYFLQHGYSINENLIKERTGKKIDEYIDYLISFINEKITQRIIDQDLNTLVEYKKFNQIRKTLKVETIALLKSL